MDGYQDVVFNGSVSITVHVPLPYVTQNACRSLKIKYNLKIYRDKNMAGNFYSNSPGKCSKMLIRLPAAQILLKYSWNRTLLMIRHVSTSFACKEVDQEFITEGETKTIWSY